MSWFKNIIVAAFAAFMLLIGVTPQASFAQVTLPMYYVDHTATGANNGSSWANAFVDLEDALAIADSPDIIFVAEGVYVPTRQIDPPGAEPVSPNPRSVAFELKNGVKIYGGFPTGGGPGGDATFADRHVEAYPTILSGELDEFDCADFVCAHDGHTYCCTNEWNSTCADFADLNCVFNAQHVVVAYEGVGSSAILDGFTITGGHATPYFGQGGGLYVHQANPTIVNCTFINNKAVDQGGAVWVHSTDGTMNLINCTFIDNWAGNQGGARWVHTAGTTVRLMNCVFRGNTADKQGGAISSSQSSSAALTVINSTIAYNQAVGSHVSHGGGGVYCDSSSLEIVNSIIWGNAVTGTGASGSSQLLGVVGSALSYSCV